MSGSGLTLHTPTITRYKIPGGGGEDKRGKGEPPHSHPHSESSEHGYEQEPEQRGWAAYA